MYWFLTVQESIFGITSNLIIYSDFTVINKTQIYRIKYLYVV
jgi:hypothetical protein